MVLASRMSMAKMHNAMRDRVAGPDLRILHTTREREFQSMESIIPRERSERSPRSILMTPLLCTLTVFGLPMPGDAHAQSAPGVRDTTRALRAHSSERPEHHPPRHR